LGALLEKPQPGCSIKDVWFGFVFISFMGVCFGGVCIADIAKYLHRPWGQRLYDIMAVLGIMGLMIFLCSITIIHIFGWDLQQNKPFKWEGLFSILIILWPSIGFIFYIMGKRKKSSKDSIFSSIQIIPIWPLFVFIIAPLQSSVVFFLLLCFVGGGDYIGRRYDHSFLGAFLGLGVFIAILGLLAFGIHYWIYKNHRH
jgi:hypothetical protein